MNQEPLAKRKLLYQNANYPLGAMNTWLLRWRL